MWEKWVNQYSFNDNLQFFSCLIITLSACKYAQKVYTSYYIGNKIKIFFTYQSIFLTYERKLKRNICNDFESRLYLLCLTSDL